MLTERITFMVAVRSGVCSPTSLVQQVNTVSALTQGRICLNIVAGHTPDEQRAHAAISCRTTNATSGPTEFLSICRSLWNGSAPVTFAGVHYQVENVRRPHTPFVSPERTSPEIFLGGNSAAAGGAGRGNTHSVSWRLPDRPDMLRPRVAALVERGCEVGPLVSLIARPTRAAAVDAAYRLIESLGSQPRKTHDEFSRRSDSVAFTSTYRLASDTASGWLTAFDERRRAVSGRAGDRAGRFGRGCCGRDHGYRDIGITQFLFMGWPDLE